jgi:putative nucleotidyltransferase with HDIG domain
VLDEMGRRRARLARAVLEARPATPVSLDALLASLHDRHPTLLAHVRRVAQFAEATALQLPVPDLARQHIVRAALLHDIGKLAMPATLLAKDGPLTPEELALVRTHSTIGAEILHGVPYLRSSAAVVAATHERWAGDGHPAGLVGEAIPLAARIIVVTDAFDALRGAAGGAGVDARDCANAELVRHAGSHFDPDIVRAWLRASENVGC